MSDVKQHVAISQPQVQVRSQRRKRTRSGGGRGDYNYNNYTTWDGARGTVAGVADPLANDLSTLSLFFDKDAIDHPNTHPPSICHWLPFGTSPNHHTLHIFPNLHPHLTEFPPPAFSDHLFTLISRRLAIQTRQLQC
ncbi:hypothetical protein C0Q70_02594 [Pomacea canaliculata]|uniref:Uncharacterized protein n=1 Tax=Pomacea canaliculata TaxID=400727 RepID=A0A2T7PQC5_POMCA|nr:hypothetical protein C0Q70_02594 [Pomacea canaliculata]